MEPLIALVVGVVSARLVGLAGLDALDGWDPALRVGVALMFLLTTYAHFGPPLRAQLVEMVPPSLPRRATLVTVTGVLELAGAVGVLIPATAPWAAAGLVLLMVAMFPANVSAARRELGRGHALGPRTALQVVFIAATAAIIPATL
jgi:uncharacterized membrane protein